MAPPRVLIAEDFPEFRKRLINLLAPLALDTVVVPNGRDAIEVLRDVSQELHLLVTDLDMPVHTGWEVIDAARAHRGQELPVIMQTGEAAYPYVMNKAAELEIVLIGKPDIDALLVPAVRDALGLG